MDTFNRWILDPIKNHYFDFKGRSTRSEFWIFTTTAFLINVVLMTVAFSTIFLGALVGMSNGGSDDMFNFGMGYMFPLLLLFNVTVIVPVISITIRRFHDVGISGWWFLLCFVFPPFSMLIIFFLAALPSESKKNKYGFNSLTVASTGSVTTSDVVLQNTESLIE